METTKHDWAKMVADLERLLKLRSNPFGMKLYESVADMEAIPKVRRPKSVHTVDQIVAQAARLGWTVGITADDLVGLQPASDRPVVDGAAIDVRQVSRSWPSCMSCLRKRDIVTFAGPATG